MKECPICKNILQDHDDINVGKLVFEFFRKHANRYAPYSSVWNIAKGIYRVGKIIYYDFSSINTVRNYFWCPKCRHYILECPKCHTLNSIGTNRIVAPAEVICSRCDEKYVYISPTHINDSATFHACYD